MSTNNASEWLDSQRTSVSGFPGKSKQISNLKNASVRSQSIAIASGKGGVGKTTMALKLARSLGESGKKVICIDFDYNLSNTALKLGLRPSFGLYDYLSGEVDLNSLILSTSYFDLLPGHHGQEKIVFSDEKIECKVIDLLVQCEKRYDSIIIDCPAGAGREVLSLCAYADKRLLVVNPDISSLTDSYSVIKLLKNIHGIDHNCVLLNRIKDEAQYLRIVKSLGETVERFLAGRLEFVGHIHDYGVDPESFDRQFFSEEKNDQRKFLSIVSKLTEEGVDVSRDVSTALRPDVRSADNVQHRFS
ncbi:MAG: AAA family ATPase [Bdellovibrio sp.]|nr:AAA family ATPase [Bdellovibrio sp.]